MERPYYIRNPPSKYPVELHNLKLAAIIVACIFWLIYLIVKFPRVLKHIRAFSGYTLLIDNSSSDSRNLGILEAESRRNGMVALGHRMNKVATHLSTIHLPFALDKTSVRLTYDDLHVTITFSLVTRRSIVIKPWFNVPFTSFYQTRDVYVNTLATEDVVDEQVGTDIDGLDLDILRKQQKLRKGRYPVHSPLPLDFPTTGVSLSPIFVEPSSSSPNSTTTVNISILRGEVNKWLRKSKDAAALVLYINEGYIGESGELHVTGNYGLCNVISLCSKQLSDLNNPTLSQLLSLLVKPASKPLSNEVIASSPLSVTEEYIIVTRLNSSTRPHHHSSPSHFHEFLAAQPTFGLWDKDDSSECCICMINVKNVIIMPCRHFCVCLGCVEGVGRCPVCRVEKTCIIECNSLDPLDIIDASRQINNVSPVLMNKI